MKYHLAIVDGRKILKTRYDEAHKLDPNSTQIEIPVDKQGLMEFAQEALDVEYQLRKQLETVAAATAEPTWDEIKNSNTPEMQAKARELMQPSYSDYSLKIEEEFEKLPVAHQLHLAAVAVENARKALP
jgi:hypothetical protein